MTTIFCVIQSYADPPGRFTQMPGAYQGVLIFSVSAPKASGWERSTSCAVLSSEICSCHSCLSLCTANGLRNNLLMQHQCVLLVSWELLGRLQPLPIASAPPAVNRAVLQAKTSEHCSQLLSISLHEDLAVSSNTRCWGKTAGATDQAQPPKSKAVQGCLKALCPETTWYTLTSATVSKQ